MNRHQLVAKIYVNNIKSHTLNIPFLNKCANKMMKNALHTKVKWLFKCNCLDILYSVYKSVVEFLQESYLYFCSEVKEISNDAAYLSCIFVKKNKKK